MRSSGASPAATRTEAGSSPADRRGRPIRIAIIQGHPTPGGGRFGHALADAYESGAAEGGHEARSIVVAELDFPLLRAKADWEQGAAPPGIKAAQETIAWAEHLAVFYPLWLGAMPALLKGFLEQALRPDFAFAHAKEGRGWSPRLGGRSARIVVTMGMPALAYRWWFGAHSLKSLERNILGFVGVRPIRHTLIGMVEAMSDANCARWIRRMRELGRRAS